LFGASVFAFNARVYQSWPADVRESVDTAARTATRYQHDLAAAEDDDMLDKLAACDTDVIHLTPAEHAAFVAALAPVLDKYRRELDPVLFSLLDR
jgi:TRAP-type C4-dicarboxylate transport system substrate-binding protein